jgi:hypothetical protein
MTANSVDLDKFLKIGPRLPDEESLTLSGFLTQQAAVVPNGGGGALVVSAQARSISTTKFVYHHASGAPN